MVKPLRLSLILAAICLTPFWWLQSSCTKKVTVVNHKDTAVNAGNPPYYNGVSSLVINSYINRLYIDLVGRVPTSTEAQTQFMFLTSHQLRTGARDTVAAALLSSRDFAKRLFAIDAADMLGSADSFSISNQIYTFQYFITYDSATKMKYNDAYYTFEINRLSTLSVALSNYYTHTISINEFSRTFIDNYFYDQINMGTENFVKACFSDLLRRKPTTSELKSAKNIVDGYPDAVLLQSANSKLSFEKIMTSTPEFYQGLTIKAYNTFLNRQPTSSEEAAATTLLQSTHDYRLTLQNIVSTKEYAGF